MTEAVPGLAGVILAAGESARLGQAKQLLEFNGRPLVRHAVAQALPVCRAGVFVVTGAHGDAVAAAVRDQSAECVHNADWQDGMAGSLRVAMTALDGTDCEAALLMVCDQPRVTTTDLAALAGLWQNAPFRATAAEYSGLPGVPAILPRSWFTRLSELEGDQGARRLLRESPDTQLLDMPHAAIDIDTLDDLTQLGKTPGQL